MSLKDKKNENVIIPLRYYIVQRMSQEWKGLKNFGITSYTSNIYVCW